MSSRTLEMTDRLYDYMIEVSVREPDVLRRLREETFEKVDMAKMQISPEQGRFMALLTELTGARKAIEIGTFTGYSALSVALAMPDDGRIVACDISEEWTNVGKPYWKEAGVAQKIDLRIAPANETLDALIADGQEGTFDMAFIDADKEGYQGYFERCLTLLRPGGLAMIDNVLWGGSVADPSDTDDDTVAIRAFNANLRDDERVTLSLVPIGDGLTLARKRA